MITYLTNRLIARLGRVLCSFRGRRFVDAIEKQCDVFHRYLNNVDFDMLRNGEIRVLRILTNHCQMKQIFDVGAYLGHWSQLASNMNPESTVHAFELVPATYDKLVQSTINFNNVLPISYGLSNKGETIPVSLGYDPSTATGCKIEGMHFHDRYYSQVIHCKVRKACDYMREQNLKYVDFVKIDTEGMDLKVIEGFENFLQNVRVIQFEYGIFNISSHDLLADFCRHLNKSGFVIGKIFPRHVKFFDYHFNRENFHGSNYIAVNSDEKRLIKRLQNYNF